MNEKRKPNPGKAVAFILKVIVLYFVIYLPLSFLVGDGDTANCLKLALWIVASWLVFRQDYKVLK